MGERIQTGRDSLRATTENAMSELETTFKDAVAFVYGDASLKGVPNDRKLILYGLYKQVKEGDVQGDRPGIFNFEGRAKWDAWKVHEGKSTDTAMEEYVAELEKQKTEFS